jgi:Tol biopolymer transport system component
MRSKSNLVLATSVLVVLGLCGLAFGQWSEPVSVTEVNSEYADWTPFLSFDGLSLYFARGRTSSYYHFRIFEATRQEPYGPFTSVNEVLSTSGKHLMSPWISPNNLRMYYFAQTEHPILWKIKVSERASVNDPWPQGTDISELNNLGRISDPRLTSDELIIFFRSPTIPGGLGGYDLWMASRPDRASPFDTVRNLTEINTVAHDVCPSVSPDGLTLIFQSGTYGDWQFFSVIRQSLTEPFSNIELLSIPGIPGYTNNHPSLSNDGSTLYFMRHIEADR